jgi:hypothetical protein
VRGQPLRVFVGSLPSTPISLMRRLAAVTLPGRGLPFSYREGRRRCHTCTSASGKRCKPDC